MKFNPATGQYEDDEEQGPSLMQLAQTSSLGRQPQFPAMENARIVGPAPSAPAPAAIPGQNVPEFAPAMPPSMMPMGGQIGTKTDRQTSTTTSRTKVSEGERKAEDDVQAQLRKQGELERQRAELAAQEAKRTAAVEDEAAARLSERALEKQQIQQAGEQEYQARKAAADEEFEKWRGMSPKDFWADKSTGERLVSALSVAAGAYAQGLSGGKLGNTALQVLQDRMDRHERLERAQIEKQLQVAEKYGSRAAGVREDLALKLKGLDLKYAALDDVVAARVRAGAARAQVPEAKLAGEQAAAQLEQRGAERRAKFLENERQQVNTTVQKKIVEGNQPWVFGGAGLAGQIAGLQLDNQQRDAATKTLTMLDDLNTIKTAPPISTESLSKAAGIKATSNMVGSLPLVGKAVDAGLKATGMRTGNILEGMNPDEQKTYLAWQRAEATVRNIYSGAGSSDAETERFTQMVIPQPGDDAATVVEKTKRYEDFIRNSAVKAGPAAPLLMQAASGQGSPEQPRQQLGRMSAGQTPGSGLSKEDQDAINWARANANDPRAAAILRMHGM